MCRVLSYMGLPISLEEMLYKPDNSFIKQSYHPKYMSYLLNLAGFGMVAWDNRSYNPMLPYIYKTYRLPFYDENLHNLADKITPQCLLAHLRGVAYNDQQIVSQENVHPFIFEGTNIALAHNGALIKFNDMKFDLTKYVKSEYQKHIRGTTDSEWIYALFLSQLNSLDCKTEDVINAILETFKILRRVRHKHKIEIASPINIFITNGEFIVATRFVFDFGWQPLDSPVSTHFAYHSLWYTFGESYGFYNNEYKMKESDKKLSVIIASEPLTEDTTTWIEVPEYTLILARPEGNTIKIISQDINL